MDPAYDAPGNELNPSASWSKPARSRRANAEILMSLKMGRLAVLPAAVFAWASVAMAHGADEAGTGDKPTATATSIPGGDTGVKGTGQGEEQEK
jgi:hypothetical protein